MTQGEAIDVIAIAFESSIVHQEQLDALYDYINERPEKEVISTILVGVNFARDWRRGVALNAKPAATNN